MGDFERAEALQEIKVLRCYEFEMLFAYGSLLEALADGLAHDDTPPAYLTEWREQRAAYQAFQPRAWWDELAEDDDWPRELP